ncbi:WXG100 family type VII secretion target [Allorhizocola rhizosphaerae]|uniref:WXG100 family type VII secretion target n=1 Tax=Allorhizocola rhizosphaerae TaxID=1872709 RepID=UPI000E3B737E|nr:WXG100 family type VII secretion target [Allorhizocola rhizosphaerae]
MATTAAEQAQMDQAANKFEQVDSSLQQMLSRLMNELETLRTAWQGASGRSFEQVKIAYEAAAKKMSEALRETAGAIRTSGQQYTATDESGQQRVNSINTNVSLNL